MAGGFRRLRGRHVAYLDVVEREILTLLLEQAKAVLEPPSSEFADPFAEMMAAMGMPDEDVAVRLDDGVAPERDPALDRLLPSAHRGDERVAREFRRLTEPGLRARKTANLTVAVAALTGATGDKIDLDEAQARSFVMALTDVRLLFADRLGLHTEEDVDAFEAAAAEAGDEDDIGQAYAMYDFLTWLQETLTQSLISS